MGLFDRWRKKKEAPEASLGTPAVKDPGTHLAFALLDEPRLPTAEAIQRSFERFRNASEVLVVSGDDGEGDGSGQVLMLQLQGHGTLCVALMEMPVPHGEAEQHVPFSISSLRNGGSVPSHSAHLLVSLMGGGDAASALASLMAFTSALAAVTEASGAHGVYWGNAGATHPADFVLSVAKDRSVMPRVLLWNGFSRGEESDGRISFLSRGMGQLGLPNLYLISPAATAGEQLQRFYGYLAYVAERGTPIPDGDTIGSSSAERIEVRYVASPADDGEVVWRISL